MKLNYIKQLKKLLSIHTQEELADKLGVSFPALNRWVNRHAKPRSKHLEAINKLYKELIDYPQIDSKAIKQIIQRANQLKRKKLSRLIQNNPKLQDELTLEQSYNSNTIEGATFSKRETEFVIFEHQIIQNKNLQEHLEIINHSNILKKIWGFDYPIQINSKLIKELHYQLMNGIREDAGEYSKHQRAIRGLDLSLCHPQDIEEEIERLLKDFNRKASKTIEDIAKFHVDFELIHPFGDGNGRIGRLLIIIQCLSIDLTPIIICNSNKLQYYDTLYYAQTKAEGPFIEFLYNELVDSNCILDRYL